MANHNVKVRLILLGGLIFSVLLAMGYAIAVTLGEWDFGFQSAIAFVLWALAAVVPLALVLGGLPLLVVAIASHAKRKQAANASQDSEESDA